MVEQVRSGAMIDRHEQVRATDNLRPGAGQHFPQPDHGGGQPVAFGGDPGAVGKCPRADRKARPGNGPDWLS